MSFSRQEDFLTKGRGRQKQRTREALLNAAMDLARNGRSPSITEVAEAADVSTATAYRYFPNTQSLWADLAIRQVNLEQVVADLPEDVGERVETVIRRVTSAQFRDEAVWREVLRAMIDRWFVQQSTPDAERVPVRGSTRLDSTRAALAPLEGVLAPDQLERLTMAVMLVFGVEAMIVARDALGLDEPAAADVMTWAAKSLIRSAVAEASE
jgi:AcrR family transcriptional regulator